VNEVGGTIASLHNLVTYSSYIPFTCTRYDKLTKNPHLLLELTYLILTLKAVNIHFHLYPSIRPVSLTSVPGKIMEIIVATSERYLKNNAIIRPS